MKDAVAYEVRTDVTIGFETFPHVAATIHGRESKAIEIADRAANQHGLRYYVVRVQEVRIYDTDTSVVS